MITFNYLIAQGEYRISTLLATLFGVGFVLGWIVSGVFTLRVRLSLVKEQSVKLSALKVSKPNKKAKKIVLQPFLL